MQRTTGGDRPDRRETAAVALLATAAFVAFAWPWVRSIADAIPDASPAWGADARLIVWVVTWIAHALATAPSRLFDGNIFHPIPDTLTGSEHFLTAVVVTGPLYALTGNPVLATNVAAMSTYVLAVVAVYVLARAVGLPVGAAAVAGAAAALGPFHLPADLHVLQYPIWVVAWVLAAAIRVERGGRLGGLALATVAAVFSSYYVAAMTAVVLACEAVFAWVAVGARAVARIAVAALPGFVLLGVFSLPYLTAGVAVPPGGTRGGGNLVAWAFFASLFGSTNAAAALGWPLLALAGLGLASPLIARTRPSLGWSRWVVLGVVGAALAAPYDLEIGPVTIPMPSATFAGTPLRANTRFFLLAQLGLAGLAAEAVALPWRVPRLRVPRGVAAVLAAGLVAVVSIPRARHLMDPPLTRLEVGSRVPAVHRWLAAHGDGPVLEPPGPGAANWLKQADTMIVGMAHWLPLLNGHTGYPPWAYAGLKQEFAQLPNRDALQALVDLTDLRWVVIRSERVGARYAAAWDAFARTGDAVERVDVGGPDSLFRVRLRPRHPWAAALARGRALPGQTALGTSLAPLDDRTTRGAVTAFVSPRVASDARRTSVLLAVVNEGTQSWPALIAPGAPEEGVVRLRVRWREVASAIVRETWDSVPRDVVPGATVRFRRDVPVPDVPGTYVLELSVKQRGGASMRGVAPARKMVVVEPAG